MKFHTGEWIFPRRTQGAVLLDSTAKWTCCGSRARLSLYCDSPAVRKQLIEEINSKEQNLSLPSISNVPNLASLQSLDESSSPCRRLSNSYEKGYDSTLIMPPIEHDNKGGEFQEDMFFQKSPVGSPTLNGYKLSSWIVKNCKEPYAGLKALRFVHRYLGSYEVEDSVKQALLVKERCTLLFQTGLVRAMLKVYNYNRNNHSELRTTETIILQVLFILRRLLDCSTIRPTLVKNRRDILLTAFSSAHLYMANRRHVVEALPLVVYYSCDIEGARAFVMNNFVPYLVEICSKHDEQLGVLLSSLLVVLNIIAVFKTDRAPDLSQLGPSGTHSDSRAPHEHRSQGVGFAAYLLRVGGLSLVVAALTSSVHKGSVETLSAAVILAAILSRHSVSAVKQLIRKRMVKHVLAAVHVIGSDEAKEAKVQSRETEATDVPVYVAAFESARGWSLREKANSVSLNLMQNISASEDGSAQMRAVFERMKSNVGGCVCL